MHGHSHRRTYRQCHRTLREHPRPLETGRSIAAVAVAVVVAAVAAVAIFVIVACIGVRACVYVRACT